MSSQQPVRNRLRVHVREVVLGQIMDQRFLKRLVKLTKWSRCGFDRKHRICTLANYRRQVCKLDREFPGGSDDFAGPQRESRSPGRPPRPNVVSIVGPAQLRLELLL